MPSPVFANVTGEMIRRLVIEPEALDEIDEAAGWYRSRSAETARLFLDTVDAALEAVRLYPYHHGMRERGTRHFVLPIFPYSIIYTASDLEVVVIACFHQHRDPREWHRRA